MITPKIVQETHQEIR